MVAFLTLAVHLAVAFGPDSSASTQVTRDAIRAGMVGVVSAVAVGINYLVRRSGEELTSARSEAAQRAVLPDPPSRMDGLEIAARYQAAGPGAQIGGDLYAVQKTPRGVRMMVGDVRGKSLGAIAVVAVAIGAFREAADHETTLTDVSWMTAPSRGRPSSWRACSPTWRSIRAAW